MNKTILRYKSDPKVYAIQSDDVPFQVVMDDISISEEFLLNEKWHEISPKLGDYQLIIEAEVNNSNEIQTKHFEINKIIQELDRSWMYACGHPLNKKVLSFVGPYVDFPDGNINGWTSNYRKAEEKVNKGKAHIVVGGYKKISHSTLTYWPLKTAIDAREAYIEANDHICTLVDLHLFAHKVEDSYSSFFFLAKAMEIVQALLPGKTNNKKENKLPEYVRSRLKSSLHQIMGLANTRYEIRHVVKDKQKCTLHDKLNYNEIDIYKHDADLLIRFVACSELGIPLILKEREQSHRIS